MVRAASSSDGLHPTVVVMASNLLEMLLAIASTLVAMASNLVT